MFNYTVEGLLLNVFFIMFPLIFYPWIVQGHSEQKAFVKNSLFYFLFAGSSVLCMIFHVTVQNGLMFDFRLIPFLLACFYSNRTVTLLLFVTMISVRFLLPGHGAYLNAVSTSLALFIVILFGKRYVQLRLFHKIVFAAGISFVCKMSGITSNLIFDPRVYYLLDAAIFYMFQALFMGLGIYIMESIIKSDELRRELIESEKMKIVSVISASVAHEIRNPLTSVRGFIQLLTQSELNTAKRLQYGSICLDELDRAQQIINDYLSLAKPHPEHLDKLDVGQELDYIGNVLSSYALLNNVEIVIDVEQDLYIMGERSKFRQSLINLAKNGVEAMQLGGQLFLTAKGRRNSVIVEIVDHGNGMTAEQIQRLGTPYFSNKEKGTGLGTMVSFNIIKNMTGKIRVDSEVEKGTQLTIVFPLSG